MHRAKNNFSLGWEHHKIFHGLSAHNDNQTNCLLLNKTLFCTLYMKAPSSVGFYPQCSVCCSASIIFVNKSYDLALACVRRGEMDKSGVASPWQPHKWLWGRTMDSSAGPGPESPFLQHQHLLPRILNYGMFCRLFSTPPPSLKTDRLRKTRTCRGYQPTSVFREKKHLGLLWC